MFRVWLLCSFLLLGSCAYLNELEQKSCESKDWNSEATRMALDGKKYSTTKLTECEARGARIDRQSYENAYAEALKRFCTTEYGEYFGREGGKYQQTCPSSLENGFLAGYSRGKLDYQKLEVDRARLNTFQSLVSPQYSDRRTGCHFNSDCETHVPCLASAGEPGVQRCGGNGTTCTSSSDCTIKAVCIGSICR